MKKTARRLRPAAILSLVLLLTLALPLVETAGEAAAASPPRAVLTFDDGYNLDHRIIDYLESEGIAASAFVIGSWAQRNPALLQEMDSLGWDVCNHTQNHPWLTRLTDQEIAAELNACRSVIGSTTGQYLPVFRPPGGFLDGRVLNAASSLGYAPVMWDFDSMDSRDSGIPVEDRVNHMVNSAGDGDIFLFHFGGKNTLELVMGLVRGLRQRGFVFVTLSELYGWKDMIRGGDSGSGAAEPALLHYFAEGSTRPGFSQWLLVLNPGDEPATVRARYYSPRDTVLREYTVPPGRRLSIRVWEDVPWQDDTSAVLESSTPVAVERMLYFNRGGGNNGGSLSHGAAEASTVHYFPEGTVRDGFDQYLAVFNPSSTDRALLQVGLHGAGGEADESPLEVEPLSRLTVRINDMVEDGDYALVVMSDVPVVAERSEYFVYKGLITGSHCVQGDSRPGSRWFFAEGTTRNSCESYLTIFNPCDYGTWLEVRMFVSDGSLREEYLRVGAGERTTVQLASYLSADVDFSMCVSSLLPVVVERAAYFQVQNACGGYSAAGIPEARERWLFCEGSTSAGFSLWLALFNPYGEERVTSVRYILGDGEAISRDYLLPAQGRVTVDVSSEVGSASEVSMEVSSPGGVVAERSTYFSFQSGR